MSTSRELEIINVKGLHARASAKFVDTVENHDATARVSKDGIDAEGDSIMGLLMLAASQGTKIHVETSGPQATELMTALAELVEDKFGEGM
ncbi:HPr family phosphocarrier protein [Aliiroseovarius sp. F47248L]|uniref:HPr family phosphocarrier protein n=1 Tax=Aliiroseovarius sp. F47248L TaxID=2926420 RepID=UPI001FF10EE9|nr:HPr family phosphocarrier protein [Aliiroseovarius sp. F47248L]MCK0140461.1 HPr family phosphocarrier protein [Aliiroseovarius sp. F47248L]